MKQKRFFVAAGMSCLVFLFIFLAFGLTYAAEEKAKVIELKFANFFPPPAGQSKICEEFIQELEARTGGRVKVRYFAGGSLLAAPAMIKGIESGTTDIGLSHVEYTLGRFPITEACDLPLGYPTGWSSNQIVNDFYNKFKPKEWDKVKVLWLHANSPSVLITKKPVRKMEDLKGMIIRAPGRIGEVIAALGGTPAPTPVVETYDAISKGVLDGSFTGMETLKTFRFGEVAKFVTISWQVGNVYTFYVAMNKDSYKKLPPDIKEIFDALCGEFRERMALTWNQIDFEAVDFGKANNVEFIDLTDEEAARWIKAVEPVNEGYVKSMVGAGHAEAEVRGWIKYLKERNEYLTAKQRGFRIKSATGPKDMRP
jgi:TRAP-type C4-dicarboxylate transport system substrate-binding protein